MCDKLRCWKFSALMAICFISLSTTEANKEILDALDSRYEFNDGIFDEDGESTTDLIPTTDDDTLPTETEEPTSEATEEPSTSKEPELPSTTKEPESPSTTKEPELPSTTKGPEPPSTTNRPESPSTTGGYERSSTSETTDKPSTQPGTTITTKATTGHSSTPPPSDYHDLDSCADFERYAAENLWHFDANSITCEDELPRRVPGPEFLSRHSSIQSGVGYMIAKQDNIILALYNGKENYAAFTFTYYSTLNVSVVNAVTADGSNLLAATGGEFIIGTMVQQDMFRQVEFQIVGITQIGDFIIDKIRVDLQPSTTTDSPGNETTTESGSGDSGIPAWQIVLIVLAALLLLGLISGGLFYCYKQRSGKLNGDHKRLDEGFESENDLEAVNYDKLRNTLPQTASTKPTPVLYTGETTSPEGVIYKLPRLKKIDY